MATPDEFGSAVANIGDVDGDGVNDLAVGADGDDTGGGNMGAVYVLLMNSNGTVKNSTIVGHQTNGGPVLDGSDYLGSSITGLGDLDGDGVPDLAVGARGDDTGGYGGADRGATYVLFMNSNGTVKSSTQIANQTNGGPALGLNARFGTSVANIGDLDADGVTDLVVGAPGDRFAASPRGAAYVLLMNPSGTVKSSVKITHQTNGGPTLTEGDEFGSSVAAVGDLDGDGVTDIAVGADNDDAGGDRRGAVYVLLMNSDGTAKAFTKIAHELNGGPTLSDLDFFGTSLGALGDLDADGVTDLAVGANLDDTGGPNRGSVHVLYLNANGSVKRIHKVSNNITTGPSLADSDSFGDSISALGDLNGDGLPDLAVGATGDDTGGISRGAVHIINLAGAPDYGDAPDAAAGTTIGNYKTRADDAGPSHQIVNGLFLGNSVDFEVFSDNQNTAANADDVDNALPDDEDGVLSPATDLTGTIGTQPTVTLLVTNTTGSHGHVYGWIDYNRNGEFDLAERAHLQVFDGTVDQRVTLTLPEIPEGTAGTTYARFRLSTDPAAQFSYGAATDGEVEDYVFTITEPGGGSAGSSLKIAHGLNGGPTLDSKGQFGYSATSLGDIDADGVTDLAVGAWLDNTGGTDRGAVYVLTMNSNGTVKGHTKIAHNLNGGPALGDSDQFGNSVASLGDLDGDGISDLAVGASDDDTGGNGRGAVHVLFMNSNGTVRSFTKIATSVSGGPVLADLDAFGSSVAGLGDLDGDGVPDLLVGAVGDDTGGSIRGAVHVLLLNTDGTVKGKTKIASGTSGGPTLNNGDTFGRSVSVVGDVNGDGVVDVAVGADKDDTGGTHRGAVHILFMNADGTVSSSTKIASQLNGGPALSDSDFFGRSIAAVGDLDGNGVPDLAIGAIGDDTGGLSRGSVYMLYLNADGTANSFGKIAHNSGGGPALVDSDRFGQAITSLGDLNGDGIVDLGVGAPQDDHSGSERGALHILFMDALDPTGTPPVITTATDQTFSDNQFTLDWDAVPGAEGYEVYYTYATTGQAAYVQQDVGTNSFTPSTPLPIGRYYIWVRVKQGDGSTSAWSAPITATVSVPAVLDPIDYQQTDLTPRFTWAAIPGATRYEIWGNNVSTGTSQIISGTNIGGTSITPGSDLPFGRYLIWVRGYDAANVASAWSTPLQFSIGPQPVAPLGPTFDTTPTFEWTTITGATTYELYLSTTGGVVTQSGLTGSSWTPAAPLPNGILRWWVRGYSGGTVPGAWSGRVDSDIGGRPVMQTPTGTGSDASPNFTWTAVDGATLYDLYVSRTDVPGLAFREDSLTTNSFDAQVLPDGDYRVWVRAFDGASFGPWSRPIDFTIDADTTGILATPTSPLVATFDTTPTFEWTNEAGAATWDFFLTNGSTVIEQTGLASATFTVGSALATGDWTWWVRAKNGSGDGGTWSDPTALHVGGRTVILAPVGATGDNTPTFQWAAVQGAGRYVLHVETAGGAIVIREDNLTGTSYDAPSALATGGYRFWVKAINAADNISGFWSRPSGLHHRQC